MGVRAAIWVWIEEFFTIAIYLYFIALRSLLSTSAIDLVQYQS